MRTRRPPPESARTGLIEARPLRHPSVIPVVRLAGCAEGSRAWILTSPGSGGVAAATGGAVAYAGAGPVPRQCRPPWRPAVPRPQSVPWFRGSRLDLLGGAFVCSESSVRFSSRTSRARARVRCCLTDPSVISRVRAMSATSSS